LSSDWFSKNFGRMVPGRAGGKKTASPPPGESELQLIPGNELPLRVDAWWWLVGAVVLIIVLLVVFKPAPYRDMLLFMRDGILTTILLTVVSFVFILVVGIVGGMGRISKNPVIHFIATLYVEVIRGIPLLVQLIWWYFAAPVIIRTFGNLIQFAPLANYQSNAFALAVVGLVICYGAYMSEIFRAGIQSIPKGQIEAARSQGMTYMQAMRYVVLPQAIRVVMPPVGNEFIMLIKDTSLVSAVAMADLTRRGREFMSTHFNPLETWTMVALLYLVLTLFFTRLIDYLEKRRLYEK
jgi:polar amino acid transport system permease protein